MAWAPPGCGSESLEELNGWLLDKCVAYARDLIAAWVTDYSTARPHSALAYQTPAGFALHLTTAIARPAVSDQAARAGRLLNPRQLA